MNKKQVMTLKRFSGNKQFSQIHHKFMVVDGVAHSMNVESWVIINNCKLPDGIYDIIKDGMFVLNQTDTEDFPRLPKETFVEVSHKLTLKDLHFLARFADTKSLRYTRYIHCKENQLFCTDGHKLSKVDVNISDFSILASDVKRLPKNSKPIRIFHGTNIIKIINDGITYLFLYTDQENTPDVSCVLNGVTESRPINIDYKQKYFHEHDNTISYLINNDTVVDSEFIKLVGNPDKINIIDNNSPLFYTAGDFQVVIMPIAFDSVEFFENNKLI